MRFLGVGDSCDLGALYLRLAADGHEVKVFIAEEIARGTLAGMIERSEDWRADVEWIRVAGSEGIILFENVAGARGSIQDEMRKSGLNVIGGSAFGDRLENDRAFALELLGSLGLQIAEVHAFSSVAEGVAFLARNPNRYVLKFNGPTESSSDNYVGRMADGTDVAAVLAAKKDRLKSGAGFVLMQYVEGIEMGVGAYFDGHRFVRPACLDWEHKRFFPGDLGELTGEMGTVATFEHSEKFFNHTLALVEPLLKREGYCGYINLNTIVNEFGVWPLEFTCRFGYPGFAVLTPLQETPWSDLFASLVSGNGRLKTRPGFSVGIVLTTPPFPYDRKAVNEAVGLPILLDPKLTKSDESNLHFGEVGREGNVLVTSGCYGWTMVVTGTGATIQKAKERAVALSDRISIPNVRYRRDIGDTLAEYGWRRLRDLGWVGNSSV